jgi:hypothetical protein
VHPSGTRCGVDMSDIGAVSPRAALTAALAAASQLPHCSQLPDWLSGEPRKSQVWRAGLVRSLRKASAEPRNQTSFRKQRLTAWSAAPTDLRRPSSTGEHEEGRGRGPGSGSGSALRGWAALVRPEHDTHHKGLLLNGGELGGWRGRAGRRNFARAPIIREMIGARATFAG